VDSINAFSISGTILMQQNNYYRPEIDGLRAIAVLAVIIFHAKFTYLDTEILQGGFLGVDVFFVISGYLITRIILKKLQENRFTILDFYERRTRRILPVFLLVMGTSIPFAWFIFLPDGLLEYSKTLLASLVFLSNILFWKQQSNYWDAHLLDLTPLLHTWSLSVEEQFYIVFPFLLIFLWRFFKARILLALLVFFVCSLIFSSVGTTNYPISNFYFLPTRAWELLAGSILAQLDLKGFRPHKVTVTNNTLSFIGLLLILFSFVFFSLDTPHPSVLTLIPVIGSMLVIWFTNSYTIVNYLLANKVVVGVGLISYGLYLWHFPIFIFANFLGYNSGVAKFLLILLTFVLSIITYFFYETPIRNKTFFKSRKTFFTALLIAYIPLSIFTMVTYVNPGDITKIIDTNYWKNETNKQRFSTYEGCWLEPKHFEKNNPFNICQGHEKKDKSRNNKNNKILVLGDSNIAGLIPGLIQSFGRESIIERVINGYLPGSPVNKHWQGQEFAETTINAVINEIHLIEPQVIIIGGYFRKPSQADSLIQFVNTKLGKFKDRIIIYGPVPRWGESSLSTSLVRQLFKLYRVQHTLPNTLYLMPDTHTFVLDNYLKKLSQKYGFSYLSVVTSLCQGKKCLAKMGANPDEITTWDYGHLTHYASTIVVSKNIKLIKKHLNKQFSDFIEKANDE
jgi:peptidoglycan/LPS O-acetylase OafA/YrhL